MPPAARIQDLSTNFLLGTLPHGACQPLSFDANCFTLPLGCALVPQRQEAACNAFCGVSFAAGAAAACGGHGIKNYSNSQPILPPATVLTKGTQRETRGNFTAALVTLFVYEAGQAALGCVLQLAFYAKFTFSLLPRSGRVGFNGFAFVVSATDRVGSGAGVGHTRRVDYEPGDPGTIQVFVADSLEKPQQAVLERRLALCEDPGCYAGRLNHVVLVIGYFVWRNDGSQNRIAPPFWIIRNSWGVEWGDRGHMRMDIQGGDGVCGINVLPSIYPIVKSEASTSLS
ncbi:unnamed protein product [Closterium sp. Naga37s-1]|nr:unnamed protein product [Closterium sp. Naga37s-1]